MCNLLNKEVEFFNPSGSDILKGIVLYVSCELPLAYRVRVMYGIHHGQEWDVCIEDILDEYGDLETEEKFYYFGEDDAS